MENVKATPAPVVTHENTPDLEKMLYNTTIGAAHKARVETLNDIIQVLIRMRKVATDAQ